MIEIGRHSTGHKQANFSLADETFELLNRFGKKNKSRTVDEAVKYYFWDKCFADKDNEKFKIAQSLRKHKRLLVEIGIEQEEIQDRINEQAQIVAYWKEKANKAGLKSNQLGEKKSEEDKNGT